MEKVTAPVGDIREYKNELRSKCKQLRTGMSAEVKADKDRKIFERVVSSGAYRDTDIVLTYVSTAIEVDTMAIIEQAFADKSVWLFHAALTAQGTWNFTSSKAWTTWKKAPSACWSLLPKSA